ncbi:4'-phosphopantetheinyl transferase superfamily protein [Paenibacillus sp. GSMTC-2017]|uniref:4'-phosphopantetheinyl transferase family protein n=1 Tax=Paenibacillus sp. GSMTC-2017 TaxID=2794350 RepID=UPI0018D9DA68|nr:4'-phosphopantetheinyl transferase superfamily protein [Paenibacillus sp. GSMTC-2017]MBH5320088.1 4'-phosphopantetheinyl transferase superfamily protein [Paenibacillus sp. GSMTC-2017]
MIIPNLIRIGGQESIDVGTVLSPFEMNMYQKISNEGRKREFLYGRYAIKKNLSDNFPSLDEAYNRITVEYGVLRFPIIKDHIIEVGLSHSKTYALSILYSKDNLVGIDMETMRPDIPIEDMLNESEKVLIGESSSKIEMAYMFFSCKEALGKALKMGLLADYTIYEIQTIQSEKYGEKEVYNFQFKRFPFLTGYCFMKEETEICSIVVPKKAEVKDIIEKLIAS